MCGTRHSHHSSGTHYTTVDFLYVGFVCQTNEVLSTMASIIWSSARNDRKEHGNSPDHDGYDGVADQKTSLPSELSSSSNTNSKHQP